MSSPYYEADDYYTGDAKAPSRWHGRGTRALGLDGEVDPETFAAMLSGQLPDGTVLGTTRHGAREHKLGWDITFSAPKSVSTLALVARDRRLLDAHDRAVMTALDYAERHISVTRVRQGKSIEPVLTGNLATATFPHFTARAERAQDLVIRTPSGMARGAVGYTTREAIAPTATATATAAVTLARAIDAEPMTVAMMLTGTGDDIAHGREAWIVDEASMMSARDAERMLASAQKASARLVLVGDVDQLGSVEAGRSFGQLQDAGMPTFVLDQIVRQTNAHTREAVEAMLAGDAAAALAALDRGGGAVIEQPDTYTRHAVIARDFANLSAEDRAQTLVLDPTREGRQRLTDAIWLALVHDGTLGDEAVTATVLEPRGLTRAEAKRATSYTPGDIVTFRQGAKGKPLIGPSFPISPKPYYRRTHAAGRAMPCSASIISYTTVRRVCLSITHFWIGFDEFPDRSQ